MASSIGVAYFFVILFGTLQLGLFDETADGNVAVGRKDFELGGLVGKDISKSVKRQVPNVGTPWFNNCPVDFCGSGANCFSNPCCCNNQQQYAEVPRHIFAPRPYVVTRTQQVPVLVPVDRVVHVPVVKHVPVVVEKKVTVPVPIKEPVHILVPIPIRQPMSEPVPIRQPIPVPVPIRLPIHAPVHVPLPEPVLQPEPQLVPQPMPQPVQGCSSSAACCRNCFQHYNFNHCIDSCCHNC